MQQSPRFKQLRGTFRRFTFPMSIFFFLWYLAYVLIAIYASDVFGISVIGSINVGMLMGLAQFVSTFGITALYVKFANNSIEPQASAVRSEMES